MKKRLYFNESKRTSLGTFCAGDTGAVPADEAERLVDSGVAREPEPDPAPAREAGPEVPDNYNDLRSLASEIADRTGIKPDDYKTGTLQEYVIKHG